MPKWPLANPGEFNWRNRTKRGHCVLLGTLPSPPPSLLLPLLLLLQPTAGTDVKTDHALLIGECDAAVELRRAQSVDCAKSFLQPFLLAFTERDIARVLRSRSSKTMLRCFTTTGRPLLLLLVLLLLLLSLVVAT